MGLLVLPHISLLKYKSKFKLGARLGRHFLKSSLGNLRLLPVSRAAVTPLCKIPGSLKAHKLELADDGAQLIYTYDARGTRTGITTLLNDLSKAKIKFKDINTTQSSLEDIFVNLVKKSA